jgi:hypothetical protein
MPFSSEQWGPTAESVVVRLVVHGGSTVGNQGEACAGADAPTLRHWILSVSG